MDRNMLTSQKFDAMGNKIAATEKKKKLTSSEMRKKVRVTLGVEDTVQREQLKFALA
jgi:hypothetical protein